MKSIIKYALLLGAVWGLAGCKATKEELTKLMQENPEILFSVIEKHPDKFLEVVNKAAKEAQQRSAKREKDQEGQKRDEEFAKPKKPEMQTWRAVLGDKSAPITVVEYSDFQCPFCKRGADTMKELLKVYPKKVKLVFKHLPLDFHPAAMPASQIFEAINMQDAGKAYKFKDLVFNNQGELRASDNGVGWMLKQAKKVGANVSKVKKDMKSDEVKKRISADVSEANKYGFRGTPGYLINGVSLRGAYPLPEFKKIVERHLKK